MPEAKVWLQSYAVDVSTYDVESIVRSVQAPWELGSARAVQVIFRPSFHPELVVTAIDGESETQVQFATAGCSLWALHRWDQQRLGPSPRVWRSREVAVPGERAAAAIWAAASDAHARTSRRSGTDGITLTVRVATGDDAVAVIDEWSPGRDDPVWPLLNSLLEVGRDLAEVRLRQLVDDVGTYLT